VADQSETGSTWKEPLQPHRPKTVRVVPLWGRVNPLEKFPQFRMTRKRISTVTLTKRKGTGSVGSFPGKAKGLAEEEIEGRKKRSGRERKTPKELTETTIKRLWDETLGGESAREDGIEEREVTGNPGRS